jgi:hypothetical protein
MASPSRGLQDFQREHLPKDDPRRKERYVLGDVHTSLIKTKLGRTIYMVHDTNLPRPYARYNVFQGSKGILFRISATVLLRRTGASTSPQAAR